MLEINFDNFPNLQSNRLKFRKITTEDITELVMLRGNVNTMLYVPRPLCLTTQNAIDLVAIFDSTIKSNQGINWGVTTTQNDKIIGIVSFHKIDKPNFRAEIGYMILPEFQNIGLVSEAVATLLEFGFSTLNFHSVEAIIDPRNLASQKVLLKNKFVKEAHFKQNFFYEQKFLDTVIYSILNPKK